MLRLRYFLVAFILCVSVGSMVVVHQAHAQALPVYNGILNRAVGGIINKKLIKMGFAANDPRIAATLAGVESGMGVAAAGVGAAAAGVAISWPALLIGAGIAAAVVGVVSLASNSDYSWSFNSESNDPDQLKISTAWPTPSGGGGSVSLPTGDPIPANENKSFILNAYHWQLNDSCVRAGGGPILVPQTAVAIAHSAYCIDKLVRNSSGQLLSLEFRGSYNHPGNGNSGNSANIFYTYRDSYGSIQSGYYYMGFLAYIAKTYQDGSSFYTSNDVNCSGDSNGVQWNWSESPYSYTCKKLPLLETSLNGYEPPVQSETPIFTPLDDASLSQAIQNIPQTLLDQPMSDHLLAAVANTALKNMAQNYPNAIPYSPNNPITPSDVAEWKAENPSSVPKVSDFLSSPQTSPGVPQVPIQPGLDVSTNPSPPVTPGSGVQVDLGADPNIGAPNLENVPTAFDILSPIFNMMPDLRNMYVPQMYGSCPSGAFDVYGKTYVINAHCDLIEDNRYYIELIMSLIWAMLGMFIVLRA